MTKKHTPAPWQHVMKGNCSDKNAPWEVVTIRENVGFEALPPTKANASLIAAAPDLLEALERMERYFGNVFPTKNEEALVSNARAAIAKATGKA